MLRQTVALSLPPSLLFRWIGLTNDCTAFVAQDQHGKLVHAVDGSVALRNVIKSSAQVGVAVLVEPNRSRHSCERKLSHKFLESLYRILHP